MLLGLDVIDIDLKKSEDSKGYYTKKKENQVSGLNIEMAGLCQEQRVRNELGTRSQSLSILDAREQESLKLKTVKDLLP